MILKIILAIACLVLLGDLMPDSLVPGKTGRKRTGRKRP